MAKAHILGLCSITLVASFLATPALARPDTRTMTCQQARAMLNQQGAVVFTTGDRLFDRYVRDRRFCQFDEALKSAWVPTKDNPQCRIGFRCVRPYNFSIFDD